MARAVSVQYCSATTARGDLRSPTLEQAIRDTLNSKKDNVLISSSAEHRRFDDFADYGVLVLNNFNVLDKGIFLGVVRFAPGSKIPLIDTGTGGQEYSLQNANTPKGRDLVRGTLYALLIDNHFTFLIRDLALTKCERYIEWFVSRLAQVSSKDYSLHFVPKVDVQTLPSIDRIVFRPKEPAIRDSLTTTTTASGTTKAGSERVGGSEAYEILKAAHFTDKKIAGLREKGVDIEVKVEVFFKSGSRKHEVFRPEIADLIRDVPDDEIVLYSSVGREKEGKIRRVAYPAEVETIGDLFDIQSTAGVLWEAYKYFIREGFIGH